jgi:hypothetical protein
VVIEHNTQKQYDYQKFVALHFMYYNFVRIHKTLRVASAMAAGISKKLWIFGTIIGDLKK